MGDLEPKNSKMRPSICTPHFATVRVASYMTAILVLNAAEQQQILTDRIEQLRVAFTRMLQRFADALGAGSEDAEMHRLVWLINNYSLCVATMRNAQTDIAQTAAYKVFADSLEKLSRSYIELELKAHLGRWIG